MTTVAVEKYPKATQPVWSLFEDTKTLFDELQQRAYSLFQERGGNDGLAIDDWLRAEREKLDVPVSELVEDDRKFHIEAAVPGLDAKDVQVTATPNEVVIRGEKSSHKQEKRDGVHFSEFSRKSVFRRFALPSEVNVDKVKAQLEKGILRVDAPKQASKSVKVAEKKQVQPEEKSKAAKRAAV